MISIFLTAAAPATFSWSPKVGMIMFLCTILAFAIAKTGIQYQNEGTKMPFPKLFAGMSHASVIAAWCLGHVLGLGTIQGLAARGML